jgi:hypothetical protein
VSCTDAACLLQVVGSETTASETSRFINVGARVLTSQCSPQITHLCSCKLCTTCTEMCKHRDVSAQRCVSTDRDV